MSAFSSMPGGLDPDKSSDLSLRQETLEGPSSPSASLLGIDEIRQLALLMREHELVELDLSRPSGESLRLRRGSAGPAPLAPAPSPPQPSPPAPTTAVVSAPQNVRYITSPFVGTFYRAPGPESSAFVEPGQKVRKGQTLCIIEAMKLMNELEAEFDCVIVEVLAENGRPVEYGEQLFSVRVG